MIPTKVLKMRAKGAMRGNFGRALYASIFPQILIWAVTNIILGIVPGFSESVKMLASGSFASDEALMEYTVSLMEQMLTSMSLISILLSFLSFGTKYMQIGLIRGQKVKYGDLFRFFSCWIQAIVCVLVFSAAEMAVGFLGGALLMLIVEVVLNLKFAFVQYIIVDAGGHGALEAFKKAWRMTDGRTMWNLFLLGLSFIGWCLLAMVTLGIALLYLKPYFELSVAALYEEKKLQYDALNFDAENL
ncbi:MAG: DUF975 family protein [Clostridia bacterium]|nr:DUF975 family protein [Clostridia bacterium]